MLTNAEIKQIRSLREKKFRDALGLFVVEGEKMVREALESSFEVVRVCRVEEEGEKAMEKMSQFSTPSPVLAVVRKPALEWAGTDIPDGLSLALDSVRDPGNMGTIIRTADWFGVGMVFASLDSVDIFNPNMNVLFKELYNAAIRLNQKKPDVVITPATCPSSIFVTSVTGLSRSLSAFTTSAEPVKLSFRDVP